jgi:preprotein translocase subunit SecF
MEEAISALRWETHSVRRTWSSLQSDYVGPKFSSSLLKGSILSIIVALALILVYIWIRFRFAYAVSSILALVPRCVHAARIHQLVSALSSPARTVAALLTIIGYSLEQHNRHFRPCP